MIDEDVALTDQVAVVTGGGAGIGQGIAVQLARHGADVVVAEIDPRRADTTIGLVTDAGRRALAVPTDVLDTEQIRAAIAAGAEQFGRIDILVNNAGGVRRRRFLEQSERSWRRHIDVNLVSMMAATAAAAPIMIDGGRGGSIINVTSIEGLRAAPMFAVYAACKAGMISFTRTMALELAEHGIRVNAIAPDLTVTPGLLGLAPGADPAAEPPPDLPSHADAERYIPLGRVGHIAECGDAAVFLCSRLARYVTGVTLNVDGGTWASSGWSRDPGGDWRLFPRDA